MSSKIGPAAGRGIGALATGVAADVRTGWVDLGEHTCPNTARAGSLIAAPMSVGRLEPTRYCLRAPDEPSGDAAEGGTGDFALPAVPPRFRSSVRFRCLLEAARAADRRAAAQIAPTRRRRVAKVRRLAYRGRTLGPCPRQARGCGHVSHVPIFGRRRPSVGGSGRSGRGVRPCVAATGAVASAPGTLRVKVGYRRQPAGSRRACSSG